MSDKREQISFQYQRETTAQPTSHVIQAGQLVWDFKCQNLTGYMTQFKSVMVLDMWCVNSIYKADNQGLDWHPMAC